MSNGDAIAALTKGPKVRVVPTDEHHGARRPVDPRGGAADRQGPAHGQLREGGERARALRRVRGLGAPKGVKTAEGFMFPATYTLLEGSPARDLVAKQLDAFRDNFGSVDLSVRQAQEPDALRRADHRLAGRARGAAGQGAPADRFGHLQPPAGRHAARDRRDDPLRDAQLAAADPPVRAGRRHAVQHAAAPRAAADADRQPGPEVDQGRRQPGQDEVPVLRAQAGQDAASTRSRRRTRSSSATARATRHRASR